MEAFVVGPALFGAVADTFAIANDDESFPATAEFAITKENSLWLGEVVQEFSINRNFN